MADVVARCARFHVQRAGAGARTVVFVHGLVMDNLSSLLFTLGAPAARSARVLLYDLRGHGLSERTPTGYGLDDMVADLDALLDAVGVRGPIDLVGNSLGGLIALAFASARPARVARLVLIDPHRGEDGWGEKMAHTLLLEGEERDRRIGSAFATWLGRHSARKSTRLAQAAQALVKGTSLVADLRASPAVTDDALRRITCPTLALYGERSDVRAGGDDLARCLSDCHLRVLPGCSHSVLWEETAEVRRQILEWLDAPAPPSDPASSQQPAASSHGNSVRDSGGRF